MSRRALELTPEQIALSEARKAKRQKLKDQPPPPLENVIQSRPWINLERPERADALGFKISTWNLLAQCLVRRELFPTSNCLKGAQRQPMLHAEILAQDADILCLQEVDSLDKLLPALEAAQYNHHYACGPGKKHGCLIAFRKPYEKLGERLINYDEQDIRSEGDEQTRRGSSFRTRNIASLVALKNLSQDGEGVVIGTTHLFWHPRYTYERCRQAGILFREIAKFQSDLNVENWPRIVAGGESKVHYTGVNGNIFATDFNFSPNDPGYSLLAGEILNLEQRESLENSRVVHVSIDPNVPRTVVGAPAEDENEAVDPDRVITNARRAVAADGLLSDSELATLFSSSQVVRSAYNEGLRQHREASGDIQTFGDRLSLPSKAKGYYEPEYTSYTHYWKTVLDYIFFSTNRPACVGGLLAPHTVKDLEPGLPQKGVCGSDHVSLTAEILLPNPTRSDEKDN